jgi:UDP-N-acetylglucosamine/UDP-N-acetylgalactosamine diphosphorylase
MLAVPDDLSRRLRQFGQDHVLSSWDRLDDAKRREFLGELESLDLEQLRGLYALRDQKASLPEADKIKPIARIHLDATLTERYRALGEQAWRDGRMAVLVVAGGQGSRLGFEHPKGMFPIGPVTGKSLFQIHAEKVLALARRYGVAVPLLVMTSPATHAESLAFFEQNRNFGLPADRVHFFCQGMMPALDLAGGKLLLERPGKLFLSPNGHGGTLTALADSGLLGKLKQRGIRTIHYFQVDNPMIDVGDPVFLGRHLDKKAQVSAKVIAKETPGDKLGVFVLVDGRLTIIEYSDLPDEISRQTDAGGQLLHWAGSPAIHLFEVDFLEQVTRGPNRIPWHVARKKVTCCDALGNRIEPARENALKFEMFIFDVLPLADRWTLMPAERLVEFIPLKNATGPDSPATVRQGLSNLAGTWLEQAGARVPRLPNGDVAGPLEISPLYALDAREVAEKINPASPITLPRYFG